MLKKSKILLFSLFIFIGLLIVETTDTVYADINIETTSHTEVVELEGQKYGKDSRLNAPNLEMEESNEDASVADDESLKSNESSVNKLEAIHNGQENVKEESLSEKELDVTRIPNQTEKSEIQDEADKELENMEQDVQQDLDKDSLLEEQSDAGTTDNSSENKAHTEAHLNDEAGSRSIETEQSIEEEFLETESDELIETELEEDLADESVDQAISEQEIVTEDKVEIEVTDNLAELDLENEYNDELEKEKNKTQPSATKQTITISSAALSVKKASNPWEGIEADYFEVITDNLTVYDNRGEGPLKPVGKLKKGQFYPIVSDYGNWWRVRFGDIYGYVRKSETVPGDSSEIKNLNKSYSNTDHKYKANQNVTVYDNTSGSLVPFGVLNRGTIFPIASDYGNWWRLIFLDRVGYVRKSEGELQYAQFEDYFKADQNLPIYDNRGDGPLKKVGEVTKGQVYPIVRDYGNWHRIQFGDIYGYVHKFDTSPDNGSSIKNENKSYKPSNRDFKALKQVTVYDNTSGSLVPFGKLEKGTLFPIATDYGNWWRVILADRVGYVRKSEVQAAFKDGDQYFRVHKENLPVYDNRGSGPLKKVGSLEKDEVFPIVRDYGNWWRIQFGDIYGYVRKSDTGYATGKEINNLNHSLSNTAHHYKANRTVTVYDNTSGSLVPFGKLDKGTVFPIATDYGNWWRIVLAERVGYVRKSEGALQLAKFNNYFKADRNTAIYDNRGSGPLKKVGEAFEGQEYHIVRDYGNWHRIQFGDIYGYVKKFDTRPSNGHSIRNKNTSYKPTSRDFTTLQQVVVYDNTSGSLVPFASLEQNVVFPIATDYGNWWRIILDDRVGYVRKSEVQAEFKKGDQYFRVHKANLPIYDNRGSGPLKKVGSLEKDQVFKIVSDYGNWWRVQFGDIYGYVRKADTGYATGREIKNLNTRYSNAINKLIPKKQVVVYDNTSGKLVAMGSIDKDVVFPIATDYGNWWRVVYLDRVGYVKKADVEIYGIKETYYNITLNEALDMQMKVSPQTDNKYAYVSKSYIKNNRVTASLLNVRSGAGTTHGVVGQLTNGTLVKILGEVNGWYRIEYNHRSWVDASREDTLYYLDPTNFIDDQQLRFQFLDLSRSSIASVAELNAYLSGKGTLSGQGKAFKDASKIHGINDIYLISHAILETGHGTSTLAQGVKYNGVTVYNMYGVGAYDDCAIECGAKKAYEEGWTTPYKAIVGGAKFIGNNYIKAGQNTLYKMRWNPEAMEKYGYATHQYATDIGWATKQVYSMYNLYRDLGLSSVYLDIPVYKL